MSTIKEVKERIVRDKSRDMSLATLERREQHAVRRSSRSRNFDCWAVKLNITCNDLFQVTV